MGRPMNNGGGDAKGDDGNEKGRRKKARECHFVDYKDIGTLKRHLNGSGKIHSRKRAGNCSKCQRLVTQAIKRARFMGILSYVN